ncbi:MAG: putative glycosyl transferase [Gemmatimonadetes bacterium]|nr:putative glycosyl transferase [Gemmatimonadota bacterium]
MSERRPVRAGFPLIGGRDWPGGAHYLSNLLGSLQQHGSGAVEPVLLVGPDAAEEQVAALAPLVGGRVERLSGLEESRRARRSASGLLLGIDSAAARACRVARIDVAFEVAQFLGWRFPIPVVSWLPDFQHRHLPQMFPRFRWWRRELGFRMQVRCAARVLVSSESAAADVRRFYPTAAARTRVARFAVLPPPPDPSDVRPRLHLPERFLALPNQFWRHKNHRAVVEALALLRLRGVHPVVAVTGSPRDARFPGLHEELIALVEQYGLAQQFLSLGVVSHADVMAIIRASIGLLNPSLFEGWSTTVEEAKALGVPLLLSDLPVHREQATGTARFFQPESVADLADVLEEVWMAWPAGPRPGAEARAMLDARSRREAFGRAVEAVLYEAAGDLR